MEKISGIIPSSSRVAAVDMRDAAPVRPGTPTFGRPEGVSSLREARIGETASRAAKIGREQLGWKAKDMQQAAVARELSDKFFAGNQRPALESVSDGDLRVSTMDQTRASKPTGFDLQSLDRVTGSGRYAKESVGEIDESSSFLPEVIAVPPVAAERTEPLAAMLSGARENEIDAAAAQPDGLHPRGTFLDVRA